MYDISNDLSPIFIKDNLTEPRNPYSTRSNAKVEKDTNGDLKYTKNLILSSLLVIKTVSCRLESIRYLGPKIWKLVSDEMK